jgi:DNA-binding NarL/FixJ family response regulator
MSVKARVLVADSSRMHTQMLSEILGKDAGLEVIGWDFKPSTIIGTALSHNVDIFAVSSELDGSPKDALTIVRQMRVALPKTKIVVLLENHRDETVLDFLRAGAHGIFEKEGSLEMLRQCLHAVSRGETWLDNRFVAMLINFLATVPTLPNITAKGAESLTKREREVLELLAQGLSNREISERMSLSEHTVKNYVLHIFDKMGVSSRSELLYLVLSQDEGDDGGSSRKAFRKREPRSLSMLDEEAEKALAAAIF